MERERGGGEREILNLFRKSRFRASILGAPVPPGTDSDFCSNSGEDHYYVGCLGQKRVSLPELPVCDHRHIMVRG